MSEGEEISPGFINQVQPPELPVFLAKTEPLIVIKNESPETDEEIIPDIKDIDIVSHLLPEDLIKSETVSETTFETKHLESVETQLFLKTENAPFVKIENITESDILNKSENTGNRSININKAKDQAVIEVQDKILYDGWNYHCDNCAYKTYRRDHLKMHKIIHLKPEEVQYFYCYHCSYKAKRKSYLKYHLLRHFDFDNGNVPFHCYVCNFVTLKRNFIITHIKKHTKFKSHGISREKDTKMNDQKLKLHCDSCTYKTYGHSNLKRHKIIHLKPEEIQFFICYHCSYKFKRKDSLQVHLSAHFRNENVPFHCYICNFVTLKRELITEHIRRHSKVQNQCKIIEIRKLEF